jgi:hypothetical protein
MFKVGEPMTNNPWAFPVPNSANMNGEEGMTLRDYFAAKAMAALLSDYSLDEVSLLATDAYKIADAMLAERTE